MRSILTDSNIRLQFAGHETFPLRILWLRKAYDACAEMPMTRGTFQEHEAIARFGVGRNMAISIRHWALAADVLCDEGGMLAPTDWARRVFDLKRGFDPYLEEPSTLWLVHAAIAGKPELATTWFYAFNGLNQTMFDRDMVVQGILEAVRDRQGLQVSANTLRRDVEVFVRSYAARGEGGEDAAEPLLVELGLVRESRLAGQFEFVRGPKPNLSDGVFALTLWRFWRRWYKTSPTISVEQASYAPGSPGRIFKLDEDSVLERLTRIERVTEGALIWSDTAGLRQVARVRAPNETHLLDRAYNAVKKAAA
ncbi:DUF4007 family protein [Oharaeibacter diazotrophicus]|uniref:Uncharacterized protein DUF4007 n=1 Tax=Oharaeibacter diazotrophicus TaxID=1920512 RepID=A0A4R6RRZ0_9HYPH|nr:DUF4007 family protein [Oharaeibacter diazotrophicus]TDP88706.1 uncharacterized protein DUF4007 [Oharaeibacter diazotrophicus]BBE74922.1 hypothetical protein OHA_3_00010 [Pleomorphomonas sp. SM30]GLS79214.1 hypothetical protein GCM10007904_45520 [Oharaeibacter diazotrophicus]